MKPKVIDEKKIRTLKFTMLSFKEFSLPFLYR